jgi:hypothetical protein
MDGCCTRPCDLFDYELKILSEEDYPALGADYPIDYANLSKSSRTVVELNIGLGSQLVKTFQQQHSYDFKQLLSEIGGMWGLLLGASFVTLIQTLETFFDNLILH